MRFCSLASGSSGNCLYVETEHTRVLVDAGFSGKQIEQMLRKVGVDPKTLDYIFVTHEHLDHAKGVGVLARRYRIPVAANFRTWEGMRKCVGTLPKELMLVFETGTDFSVRDLDVHALSIFHDAKDPVGFVFFHQGKKLSILTDTGFVSETMTEKIKHSDLLFLESNHDTVMLEEGPYPLHLKQRIRSTRGHLSNEDSAHVLDTALKGRGETVFLGHLSHENNVPLLAMDTVSGILTDYGLNPKTDIVLRPAARFEPSGLISIK